MSAGKTGEAKAPASAVPAAPLGVSAVSGSDRITVKWSLSERATSYNIYVADKPGMARTEGQKIPGIIGTSYEHRSVEQGTMYYYVVTASNEGRESPASAESGAMVRPVAPQAPQNVAASGGDGSVTIKWNGVPGAITYTLYYATAPGIARAKGKKIEVIRSARYQLTEVKKKVMYFIAVSAVNAAGESPASNESGAMP